MFKNLVNFQDTQKVDHILESSLDSPSFFDALYQLLEFKDDFQVVSQCPCLLEHPVYRLGKLAFKRKELRFNSNKDCKKCLFSKFFQVFL